MWLFLLALNPGDVDPRLPPPQRPWGRRDDSIPAPPFALLRFTPSGGLLYSTVVPKWEGPARPAPWILVVMIAAEGFV